MKRDGKNNVERQLFVARYVDSTLFKAPREIAIETCYTGEQAEKNDESRKGEIHPFLEGTKRTAGGG